MMTTVCDLSRWDGREVETTHTEGSFEKFPCELGLSWRQPCPKRDTVQERLLKTTANKSRALFRAC